MASADPKPVICNQLDVDAVKALKQFVKKNAPIKKGEADFKSEGAIPVNLADLKASGKEIQSPGSASTPSTFDLGSQADESEINKFDIFDNVDEDRISEFKDLFAKSRAKSNYDEFCKKKKKADPNKFMTVNHVDNSDGRTIMS